jgi:hypothetical protein
MAELPADWPGVVRDAVRSAEANIWSDPERIYGGIGRCFSPAPC